MVKVPPWRCPSLATGIPATTSQLLECAASKVAHFTASDHTIQAHKQAADAIMAAEARETPTVLVANNVLWFEADPERSVNFGLLNLIAP